MRLSPSAHLDTFCRDRLPPQDQWPEFRFDLPELELSRAAQLRRRAPRRHRRPGQRQPPSAADRAAGTGAAGTGAAGTGAAGLTWSYDEVVRPTNQLARVLTEDLGVVPGNRVLLRGPNNPWLAACWLGVLKAGAVAVTTMSAAAFRRAGHDLRGGPAGGGAV